MIMAGADKVEISFCADRDSRTFAAKCLRDLIGDLKHEFHGQVTDSIFTQSGKYARFSRATLNNATVDVFSKPQNVKAYFPLVGYCRISPTEKASVDYYEFLTDFEQYLIESDLQWHYKNFELALDTTGEQANTLRKYAIPVRFIDSWQYESTIYLNRKSARQIKLYQMDGRPLRYEITFTRDFIRQRNLKQLTDFYKPQLITDSVCLRLPKWSDIQKRCGKSFTQKLQQSNHSAFVGQAIAQHCQIDLKHVWERYFQKMTLTDFEFAVRNNNNRIRRLNQHNRLELLTKAV